MTSHRARSVQASVHAGIRWRLLRSGFAVGSWLLPTATVRRAHRLFDTPAASSRTRAQAHAPPPGLRFLPWQGERLALYRWGDPDREPTVLLVHGWSSFGQRFMSWLPALRAAGYAVVAFDHRGHGRSSGRRNDLAGFVDAVSAVERHLAGTGVRHDDARPALAAVIGHSLGAAAVALALSRGLRAQRVVLVAPPADLRAAKQRFARLIGLSGRLVQPLLQQFHDRTGIDPLGLQPHRYAPALSTPALVIHDCTDEEVPWGEGEQYARCWPGARLLSTQGLGHRRILDAPQVIEAAVRFVDGGVVGDRVVSTPNLPVGLV
ncbi:alpha/beta hydrolase [Luteimonas kalidii]|uniref:Alpha/beta fold hydrolase n=1 Tax=Luteimonas kalidii TaxID=3042025 RepID=A0ABT6JQP6_9GAMM|nr:alpha/beta fold hydrolase [Luteimonas kalidii]MDH5832830.1 alpha/beta fold hydrolase [Luteimonas kalidii]